MRSYPSPLDGIKSPFGARRGPVTFSPLLLFAGGVPGAWYDPSDLSTMFQDTAGSTPITAAGQSVARINDKSGLGNHWTQATALSRPTYEVDGTLRYLNFDGVDDQLATNAGVIPLRRGAVTAMAMRYAAGGVDASQRQMADLTATGTSFARFTIRNGNASGSVATRADTLGIASLSGPTSAAAAVPADANMVLALKFTDSTQTLSINGTDLTPVAHTWGVSDSINSAFNSGFAAFNVSRRIYGAFHVARNLTAQEFTDLNAWLSAKAGL